MKLMTTKRGRFTYLYAVKSFRKDGKSTSKIVEKFGTLEDLRDNQGIEDPIAWAQARVAELTDQDKEERQEVLVKFKPNVLLSKGEQQCYNGGFLFLQKVYFELGLDKICEKISRKHKFEFNLNRILSNLIYTRIMYPGSKLSSVEDAKRFVSHPKIELHDVYRALSVLAKENDIIQADLFKRSQKVAPRKTDVIYYDCTNYFFEIEEAEGLKQYGISKEHRPNPIVQMGLFMDGDGIPLAFAINPGNTNEQVTLKPLEMKLDRNFSLSKIIACTDAGLSSLDNRQYNNTPDRKFITVQSLKKSKEHIRDWALDPSGWRKADSDQTYDINAIDEDEEYETRFHKSRWIVEDKLPQRIIVTYSVKFRDYLRNIRDKQIDRADKAIKTGAARIEKKRGDDYKRFIKKTQCTADGEAAEMTSYSLNQEMIDQEERFDGFYAVCTNIDDENSIKELTDKEQEELNPVVYSDLEVLKFNSYRWMIEYCFRVMKTDFKARPVYLKRDDRIVAHFLTCFISLVVMRYLQRKIRRAGESFSEREIIDTLTGMNFKSIDGEGYVPVYTRTTLTDRLHGSAGFRTDTQIVTKARMKKIIAYTKNTEKD